MATEARDARPADPSGERPRAERPPARPPLLPPSRAARLALGALLAFALLRGLVFAMTIPAFWAPDEDYHFLYADYLMTQHRLIDPDRPLYPREYGYLAQYIRYDDYGSGPRTRFSGDPKASLRKLERLPKSARRPVDRGRGVGVVHPPLYPLMGALVDATFRSHSMLTRLTAVRVMTAFLGALAVYLAWLLAAQVLGRFRDQLLAAFLFAVQPMVAYLAGVVNHDTLLIALMTGSLAMMLFILRAPPRPRQGLWLGGFVVLALFVKGTALVLLPLAALAYLGQALTWRPQWRQAARSALVAGGMVAVLAGWWYVRAKIVYGSAAGATTAVGGTSMHPDLGEYLAYVKQWTGLTYRTYWFHFVFFEVPGPTSAWYFVPIAVGGVGIAGLAGATWGERGRLLDPGRARLRQIALLVLAAFSVYLPFLAVDVMRRAAGLNFFVNGGRYLLPAYAGVAVLLVVGLKWLFRGRAQPVALWATALVGLGFFAHVFDQFYLERYFGKGSVGELLRRISFDRPALVTPFTLGTLGVATVLALIALVVALRGADADNLPAAPS